MTADRRMTVIVAIACVLTSTVMYPLFYGAQWFYLGIGAVLAVAASGTLSRLRTLPVAALPGHQPARPAALPEPGVRATPFAARGHPDADLAHQALGPGRYRHDRRQQVRAASAKYLPGLVLLAAGGIGLTAVMADLIAVRLRSTALAGLPLLVLFTVPITMKAPSGVGTVIVFCLGAAGYLAMLSADGRERIRVWGRLVSLWRSGTYDDAAARRRAGEPDPGPDTRALAAAGRRVGLASVVLALCIPLIVPGLHPSKLFSTGPGIGGSGGTSPALDLPDMLSQTLKNQEAHPTTVLTYTISPQVNPVPYLREVVYDTLTSSGWEVSGYAAGESEATTLQSPQGLSDPTLYPQVTITVNVTNDGALTGSSVPTFLAVPYPRPRRHHTPRDLAVRPGTDGVLPGRRRPGQDLHGDQLPGEPESPRS